MNTAAMTRAEADLPLAPAPHDPTPKPKRSRQGYIVALGPVERFSTKEAAEARMAQAMALSEDQHGSAEPTLIAGRVLKGKYTPPKMTPGTFTVGR